MATSRRQFLVNVGQGMLVAGVGYSTAFDLGLASAIAGETLEGPTSLSFGRLDPLVRLMQETPADKLLPQVVALINKGTTLRDLTAAASLANARAFGGEDYVGFHTLMALGPAYSMSQLMPSNRAALPVLKVLYRNTNRLQENGGLKAEVLKPVKPSVAVSLPNETVLRLAVAKGDIAQAEAHLARVTEHSPANAFNDLLPTVEDDTEVHRVVLAHRAWDMIDLVGKEHAQTMLRQSLRYCVKNREWATKHGATARELLPKLLEQHKLPRKEAGTRKVDDAWIDRMSQTLFTSTAAQAADAVAGALAEGIAPSCIGEAIALAANQLVLRDAGRREREVQKNKPLGSVHGDSIGVHACDSAHAWRQIATVSNARNNAAALILAGYQVALDRIQRGGDFLEWKPRPYQENLEKIAAKDAGGLLKELDGAIRENNQAQACAVAHRYGDAGFEARAIFDVLLKYATSEDGALHAEKFYRTASDEFAAARPAFRWRQVVALARVTASEFGTKAPGYEEACKLLKVEA